MGDRDWTVHLPKTAAAWEEGRTEDLEWTLDDDLAGNLSEFLDNSCESGGWPEDDDVVVDRVNVSGSLLTADVTVHFTEVVPSSCKDMPYHQKRDAHFVVTLKLGSSTVLVNYSTADPTQWDLLDRNSAADGT